MRSLICFLLFMGLPGLPARSAEPSAPYPTLPRFVDRGAAAGLSIVTYSGGAEKNHILESSGNGILVLDYDRDGYQDLYFVAAHRLEGRLETPDQGSAEERSALYRNNGDGTFTDVTHTAGVAARVYGHGGCIGDVDGDGLPDIYLTAVGPNILYRNNGDGTFSDITEDAGVGDAGHGLGAPSLGAPSLGATFFDADGDGDLDLFVANYLDATWEEILAARRTRLWQGKVLVMDGPKGLPESRNTFYRNTGDATFEEATEASGLAVGGRGYSMGVVSFDYDNDGDVDLYVANDSSPNRLYRNRGDATFEEVGTLTGSAYNSDGRLQGSMGTHFGDYDGDGWFDLVVTNFARDYNTLYRNLGGLLFQDDSFLSHLAAPTYKSLGWGALFVDVDNDRDLDLFFANGHIYPQVDIDSSLGESYRQRNQLLINDNGRFRELRAPAGEAFALERSSRGAVYLDYDNDGDLDFAVSNQDERPTLAENTTMSENHWVTLKLDRGFSPKTMALGARIEVRGGGVSQIRQSTSGGSYVSHSDSRLHVGLGDAAVIDRLTVTWPNGARTSFVGLLSDRFYSLRPPDRQPPPPSHER